MDGMIQLYANYLETIEKKSMGFRMSDWDDKLLKYGEKFEAQLMDLSVNIPVEKALDTGWQILAECFSREETGLRTELLDRYWPGDEVAVGGGSKSDEAVEGQQSDAMEPAKSESDGAEVGTGSPE
jgi:V/A-type H+-transporting ATPase subunit B